MPYTNLPRGTGADPGIASYAVTPSDTVDFVQGTCRALYIGVTGDVTLVSPQQGGGVAAILYKAVPVGILPVGCSRVNNTATTATNIVAIY